MTELTMLDPRVEEYVKAHTTADTSALAAIAQATEATMESPQMLAGHSVGRLLELLVFVTGARRVLEIGTFTGYSALTMAAALGDDGEVVTIEFDPENARVAQSNFDAHPTGSRIALIQGAALDVLPELEGPFDVVFMDAAKHEYPGYLEAVLPKLAPRGLIAADNTLWSGRVVADDLSAADDDTRGLAAFNEQVASNPALAAVLLPLRDGVTLVSRRPAAAG